MSITEQIHDELESLTVDQLSEFAQKLGGYNWDKVTICHKDATIDVYIHELTFYVSGSILCKHIRPAFFYGGPTGCLQCKGSLRTFAADRALATACEKGIHFVRDLMVQVMVPMRSEGAEVSS